VVPIVPSPFERFVIAFDFLVGTDNSKVPSLISGLCFRLACDRLALGKISGVASTIASIGLALKASSE
jgi:hypothetical protein